MFSAFSQHLQWLFVAFPSSRICVSNIFWAAFTKNNFRLMFFFLDTICEVASSIFFYLSFFSLVLHRARFLKQKYFFSQISKQIHFEKHNVLHHSYAGLNFGQSKVNVIPKPQHHNIYVGSPNPGWYRNTTCSFEVTLTTISVQWWRNIQYRHWWTVSLYKNVFFSVIHGVSCSFSFLKRLGNFSNWAHIQSIFFFFKYG